ncbi:serine aminopeptidase domain-containing protein [Mameliella alba]|uniref:serine aminopeptidase domain-containing protein n=1 Tax=Mameliella alba TaxID=561184 RepID=UPI001430D279
MSALLWGLGALAAAGGAYGAFAPREPVVTDVRFDAAQLDGGVNDWLARSEAKVPNLRPGAQKQVIWAGAPEVQTDWALVYVHGFSAAPQEIRPVPDMVAQGLGANLVFTRLKGHGRDGPAMAEATVEGWMEDMAEALAIGHRIGRRVLLMGCSTGATLATLALHEAMGAKVTGVILVSPNYKLADPKSALITWPGARWWVPWLAGREIGFEPRGETHGQYWTSRYPSLAVLPMGAAVREVHRRRHRDLSVPALFVFDPGDRIVDHGVTRQVAARWGARAELHELDLGPQDDPSRHLVAGDVLSPRMSEPVAGAMLDWARRL